MHNEIEIIGIYTIAKDGMLIEAEQPNSEPWILFCMRNMGNGAINKHSKIIQITYAYFINKGKSAYMVRVPIAPWVDFEQHKDRIQKAIKDWANE